MSGPLFAGKIRVYTGMLDILHVFPSHLAHSCTPSPHIYNYYIHSSVLCADLVHVNIRTSIGLALRAIVGVRVATRNVTKVN